MSTSFDYGLAVQGIGALAGAWGEYETGKEANKLKKEQFEYEKAKDLAMNTKMDSAQLNLDNAFGVPVSGEKKKKNPDGTDVVESAAVA